MLLKHESNYNFVANLMFVQSHLNNGDNFGQQKIFFLKNWWYKKLI